MLWYNDADGEADHPRFAKYLFTRTNRHIGCEKTMTAEAERRDVLHTLLDLHKRERADAAAADATLEVRERATELTAVPSCIVRRTSVAPPAAVGHRTVSAAQHR